MKRVGIVAHSAEGGALCFITACREGQKLLGAHMHPEIVVSAIPMGLSMASWESGDYDVVSSQLRRGVEQVAQAGADFFICPDNTAHIVLQQMIETLPIPGIHIADVVCDEMNAAGWRTAGLLGTKWTMDGPVYPAALRRYGFERIVPGEGQRERINRAIFDELCQGRFLPATTDLFVHVIRDLAAAGADCVILGCTEIPLIITDENSPLPVLDSTRLLAKHAVREALNETPLSRGGGWLSIGEVPLAQHNTREVP
ncbi:MAG: aspartate/glutamate racemase family protein [Gemmatimonadota bacterium]